jgi:tetratricopeptide (TPR) repeat protein
MRSRKTEACGAPASRASEHRWSSRLFAVVVLVTFVLSNASTIFSQRRTNRAVPPSAGSLIITTEPNAIIWIDEIRRGVTDASGRIELKTSTGRHTLRARAMGFKEITIPLVAGKRNLSVKLIRTTDQAELTFQQAEDAREKARDDAARQQAAELYRAALKLRPANSQAHVGLARVLLDLSQHQPALEEIDEARRSQSANAEASAVEGRINRDAGFTDDAIASFRRAIKEGRGFQPEAHVGLARVFEDKGQNEEAILEYRKAIDQLSDSEPVIYQLLGAIYEKQQKFKEAVAAYEKYLALAPNGSLAPAIRSIIEQVRRDAAGQEIIP